MKVLVTGSEGSLMQWVIKHLLNNDHHVVGTDNHARYENYDHTRVVNPEDYEFHKVDLTDYGRVMDLVQGVDGIINAAALIYGVKGFHENPADILSNDITVHRNILESARTHGIDRVAYISSSMVYEQDEPPHHEGDVWESQIPSTDYGLSKVVGERMSMAFKRQYDVNYTIWRPFNIITPHEKSEGEDGVSHVFADFIRKILVEKQNPMEIFGDGRQVRCFTWIDEVAEAIASKSFSSQTKNESYNLANPEPTTMMNLAKKIFRKGKKLNMVDDKKLKFRHVETYEDDVKKRVPSVEKAKSGFGWSPQTSLDTALDKCIKNVHKVYIVETDERELGRP